MDVKEIQEVRLSYEIFQESLGTKLVLQALAQTYVVPTRSQGFIQKLKHIYHGLKASWKPDYDLYSEVIFLIRVLS